MNIIKITPLLKKRVKVMCKDLIPQYQYVRITGKGLVILKSKWWSFKRTIINITDLFIDVLPKKLAESCKRKGYGDTYERLFSNDIYVMLQLKAYKKNINIEEYIWEKYNRLHREVPSIQIMTNIILESPEDIYLPILSPVSSYFIPGVEKLLKRMKKRDSVESLIEKISKIQRRALHEVSRFVIKTTEIQYAVA